MLVSPVETPAEFGRLVPSGFALPTRTRCETFVASSGGGSTVVCLLCTAPAQRAAERFAVGFVTEGTQALRGSFQLHLEDAIRSSAGVAPGVQKLVHGACIVLLTPWAQRGELKSLVAAASASWRPELSHPASAAMDSGATHRIGVAAPDPTHFDHSELKSLLMEFVLAFDSPFQTLLRKTVRHEDTKVWDFPLGCRLHETLSARGVAWEMGFQDFESLECASQMIDAAMATRSPGREHLTHEYALPDGDRSADGVLDTGPMTIRLIGRGNTRAVRIEVARLLQNVVLRIARAGQMA